MKKRITRRVFCGCLSSAYAGVVARAQERDSVAILLRIADGKLTISKHGGGSERRAATPGSVIKPLVLSTLLERCLLTDRETFLCPGALTIKGRQLHCVHPHTATPMNVDRAIAYSCNCAVAHWSARTSIADLSSALNARGFHVQGAVTDVRLLALGEEGLRLSPLELLGGYRRLHPSDAVWAGMEGAVRYGTAQGAALPGVTVAGKTGSGGTAASGRVAWFAGFAPSRSPETIAVVMAAGSSGGADAAPLARNLWSAYFGSRS